MFLQVSLAVSQSETVVWWWCVCWLFSFLYFVALLCVFFCWSVCLFVCVGWLKRDRERQREDAVSVSVSEMV